MTSRNKVVEIIANELEVEQINVLDNCTLDALGVSSPDRLEIALILEKEFKIEVGDKELWRFQTVGDVIAYVNDRSASTP